MGKKQIFVSGYSETGEEGVRRQAQLIEAAGAMRILGPNTIGWSFSDYKAKEILHFAEFGHAHAQRLLERIEFGFGPLVDHRLLAQFVEHGGVVRHLIAQGTSDPKRIGMTGSNFVNAHGLQAVVARHPQVERLLCGHLHRPMQRRFGGSISCVCPGTSHQIVLDLDESAPAHFNLEPAGYLLHRWHPQQGLVTHNAVFGNYDGPYPFYDADGLID